MGHDLNATGKQVDKKQQRFSLFKNILKTFIVKEIKIIR